MEKLRFRMLKELIPSMENSLKEKNSKNCNVWRKNKDGKRDSVDF